MENLALIESFSEFKDDKMIEIDTPQRLRYEAGYAVQMNTRMKHFQDEVDDGEVVLVDLESEPFEEPVRTARSYLYPRTIPKNVRDGINQLDSDDDPTPLQKDELFALRDYPRAEGCCGSKKRRICTQASGPERLQNSEMKTRM